MTTTLQAPDRDGATPTMSDLSVLEAARCDGDGGWDLVVQGPHGERLWTRRSTAGHTMWRHTAEGRCRQVPVRVAVHLTVAWLAEGAARLHDADRLPPTFAVLLFLACHTCRMCGCTDERACEGGCSWAAPGLCTGCVPANQVIVKGTV